MSGLKQQERVREHVLTELDAGRFVLTRNDALAMQGETLGQLIDRYTLADARWSPETDGLTLDIADEIKLRLMAEHGLSKAQVDALGAVL